MAKPDWGELQQRFLSDNANTGVSPKEWCEAQGLNYATARRYIKKPSAQTAQKPAQKKLRTAQKEKCAEELVDDDGLTVQQRSFVAEYLKDGNATQAATSFFNAPVDNAGALRYSFKEVSALSLNGVAGGAGFCVDTFNIQFDNNMQTQRCIGTGSAFAGANIPTTFTPSGQITLSWSKAAWEVYKKTFTGETVPFSFTLENAEGAYTFDFPEVQISGDWPDAGSTDIVQVQLDITAANTPPTITRAPKVAATGITVAPTTSSGAIGTTVIYWHILAEAANIAQGKERQTQETVKKPLKRSGG